MLFLLIFITQPLHLNIYPTIFLYSLKTHMKKEDLSHRIKKSHAQIETNDRGTNFSNLLQFLRLIFIISTLFWICIYIDTSATTLAYKCYGIMPNQGVLMSFVVGMVNVTRQIDKCYDLLLVRRNNYDVYEGKKTKIQHKSVIF